MRVALPHPALALFAILLAALAWAFEPSAGHAQSAEEEGLRIATDAASARRASATSPQA